MSIRRYAPLSRPPPGPVAPGKPPAAHMSGRRRPVAAGLVCAVFAVVSAAGPTSARAVAPEVPAASSTSGGWSSLSAPGWYQVPLDHPVPGNYPLPEALMLGRSGTGPTPVIDVAQAQAVFGAMWDLRDDAFRVGSNTPAGRSLMAEFESGPALESDEVTCGCTWRAVRGPISAESLLVTRQTTYPATFLGEATTNLTGSPYVQYLIISRQSVSEPWKVVSDPGYLGRGALDGPGAVTDGFDTAVPPGPASRALPQQLASYWQEWTITGHVPASSDLAPGQWTTQAGALMATTPDGAIRHFNGLAGYYFYHGGSPQEIWQFGTATGGLTCGVVREETYWDLPGYTLYQPKAQNNWGRTIAPGLYAAIVDSSIAQPCFLQGPGSKLGVVSGELDDDSMLGLGWQPLPPKATTDTTTGA